MLDLIIRGGTVVDGTGAPAVRADVGVRDGRIVVVGEVTEDAAREVDATGRVVAPGFIDLHTHYDPQVMWDPAATPSSLHGITTVIGGNCGFSIAPSTPEAAEYLVPMLARVEGMPVETLEAGLDLEWDGFGSWLERLDGRLAVNAGFLVGHSALRRVVMGADAVGHEASPAQLEAMVALLHESLAAGGLGFSSTSSPTHSDHEGRPVPSRFATDDEFVALAGAVGDHEGTTLEFIPGAGARFTDAEIERMTAMSVAAGRPLNWNVMVVSAGEESKASREAKLAASDHAAARGGRVVGLCLPEAMRMRLSFATGFVLDIVPGWAEVLHLPHDQRRAALGDPETRRRLAESAATAGPNHSIADYAAYTIVDAVSPDLHDVVGRTVADIAVERGVEPIDALLDIVVADDLMTGLEPVSIGTDDGSWAERVRLLDTDPRVIAGGSDAGAHLDMMKTFACHTSFLAEAVRARGLMSLERAVQLFTEAPARLYGLTGRGRVAEGWCADLVVFDPATVGPGTVAPRQDLPGGGWRLFSEATGIDCTIVNGVEIVRDGRVTGDTPGTTLRSGRDTETVAV
ncbi:N-acyl-D-amino-acid deacylase family protein [Rhabdothermincola salaria]|uniref:N-acyl-D-amino-acid deacylase family protein n=1 Tax=Rhabdothermincola salaria TaxID=2903142 RepID=UPI001E39CC9F|nr:amidohydrolase family protein [Rhabdothermincola salaria]MCD9625159.1 amidohydrolase family protein [Rhabdothermincola salaria]